MKSKILFVIVAAIVLGCAQRREGEEKTSLLSHFIEISESENLGVKDVLGFYGGQCEYSIGRGFKTGNDNTKYFELLVSKSEGFEKFANNLEFAANNIAYRFYRNLTEEERKEYTHIRPVIEFPEGKKSEFEISTWELEIVDSKMIFLDSIVNIIRKKNFDDLAPMLDDSTLVSFDKFEMIENLKKFDPQFGNVTDEGFRIFGYRFQPFNNKGKDALYIGGAIMRDIQANEFSIVIDPYSEKKEILLMQYAM